MNSKIKQYLPLAAIAAGVVLLGKKNSSGVSGTFSPNAKLDYVLSEIYDGLSEMGREEVRRYMRDWPKEPDYNIAQFGNLLAYYDDIRKMYRRAGYKSMEKMSNDALWQTYLRQVGWVAYNYFK